jgi:cytochrome oxidase Cu insertion factor (SCO1/SenC/PrrC family)/DNA-binding beta-propeller fold protein YncE
MDRITTRREGRGGWRWPLLAFAGWWAAGALLGAAAAAPTQVQTGRAVEKGIALALEVEPLGGEVLREGEHARVRLTITDSQTGSPISGAYPGGWIDRLPQQGDLETRAGGASCKEKVEAFLGGSILSRPEVDLNVYYVVSLNEDNTLSVVDPLFGYGSSKLLAMVFLESVGEDWALGPGAGRIFVSMPEASKVAVVDTESWKVIANLPTGPHPRRVALQPDGAYLWVAYDGGGEGGGVTVIDTRQLAVAGDLRTGRGAHDLAFSDDSRFAFVTNEADGTVSVLDVARLAEVRRMAVGPRPVSVAWSKLSRAAYVVAAGDGSVTVVDPTAERPRARAQADPGSGAIRFAPGGRLGFIVNTGKNEVHVLDAASNQVVQTADVEDEPDQVTFSGELAYVRHKGSDTMLMIPWKQVGERGRQIPAVDFTGGQTPPGRMAVPTPADGVVEVPGDAAVLVANYGDQAIYFYKEGMAAPMGSFKNYGKSPRALLVVDRTLRETKPGVYETTAKLSGDGGYDVALFLDSPRLIQCFPIRVAADPRLAAARRPKLLVTGEGNPQRIRVGEEVAVRFRIDLPREAREARDPADPKMAAAADGTPLTGLQDVQVLTFRPPGAWQIRQWAKEVGGGRYEVRFTPPEAGLYYVFVEVASRGLVYQQSPYLLLTAEGAEAGAAEPAAPSQALAPAPAPLVLESLRVPDVAVVDSEGRPLRFYRDLVAGKVVAMNFIFTTCTTICPPMGANFAKLQALLGERSGRDVQLISVSVDPRTDTPARMKEWGEKFGRRAGWTLVTGERAEITKLLKTLGVFSADKSDHSPLVLLGNDGVQRWTRTYGLTPPAKLAELLAQLGPQASDTLTATGEKR